ncbi:MAG: hypothetical protein IJU76_15675 [Desulfovibrionaceae bacterium]|nr:hypothetical protein [Desulfovibrionaceae bacterium]
MSLPLIFNGHATRDLINQWERVCAGITDGSGDYTAGVMNEFLMEYKLCPISWV